MRRSTLARVAALLCLVAPAVTAAAPQERQLEVHLTVAGPQHWKAGVQSTEASTTQVYDFATRLRSNGFLYSDDLLDPDPAARTRIKAQFYAREGLLQLKADNGGRLPRTDAERERLGKARPACADEFECHLRSIERFAALDALKSNTPQQLDEFLAAPGGADTPRYLYFFGFPGCASRLHLVYEAHVAGQRAYNHARTDLVPYALDRKAESAGSDEDRRTLCEKYVVVVDTRSGRIAVENLFIPSATGTSVERIGGVRSEPREMPVPASVLKWTSDTVRDAADGGSARAVLDDVLPLDGNATVMGEFRSAFAVEMKWSFKPVTAAAPGTPPAPR